MSKLIASVAYRLLHLSCALTSIRIDFSTAINPLCNVKSMFDAEIAKYETHVIEPTILRRPKAMLSRSNYL